MKKFSLVKSKYLDYLNKKNSDEIFQLLISKKITRKDKKYFNKCIEILLSRDYIYGISTILEDKILTRKDENIFWNAIYKIVNAKEPYYK